MSTAPSAESLGASRPLRVAFVIDSAQVGGAEQVLCFLLQGLRARGVVCAVICPAHGPMIERYETLAATAVRVPRATLFHPAAFLQLVRFLRQWKPDIVHTCLYTSDVVGIAAARWAGVPHVVAHLVGRNFFVTDERGLPRLRKLAASWSYRMVYRWADRLVGVSDAVTHDLLDRPGIRVRSDRLRLIRHLFTETAQPEASALTWLRMRLRLPQEAEVVTVMANLIPLKGHHDLVEAMSRLRAERPGARCVMAGDGPERSRLEAQVHRLGLEGCVQFTGTLPETLKPVLLQLSDVVVLPSLSEGLPVVLLEAMAYGRPIVATDVGGTRELIEDGRTGLLVRPRDPAALASAVRTLLADRSRADEMGRAASAWLRQRQQTCDPAAQFLALYEELVHDA